MSVSHLSSTLTSMISAQSEHDEILTSSADSSLHALSTGAWTSAVLSSSVINARAKMVAEITARRKAEEEKRQAALHLPVATRAAPTVTMELPDRAKMVAEITARRKAEEEKRQAALHLPIAARAAPIVTMELPDRAKMVAEITARRKAKEEKRQEVIE